MYNELADHLYDFFQKNPNSHYAINQLNDLFGENVHDYLVSLEKNKCIIRCKLEISGKPVTHWQYNGMYDLDNYNYESRYPRSIHSDYWRKDASQWQIKCKRNENTSSIREISLISKEIYPQFSKNSETHSEKRSSNSQYSVLPRPVQHLEKSTGRSYSLLTQNQRPFSSQNNIREDNFLGTSIRQFNPQPHDQMSPYVTQPMRDTSDCSLPSPHRIYSRAPKSSLNILSPEFVPRSLNKPIDILQKSQNKSIDSSVKSQENKESTTYSNNLSPAFMTALSKNPVSVLHEFCQQRAMNCEFKIIEMQGPAHKPKISTAVFINGRQFETVVSTNKKEGKRKAADVAIRNLIAEGYFTDKSQLSSKSDSKTSSKMTFKNDISLNKESGNSHSMYDHIASLVYDKLAELIHRLSANNGLSLAGRKVVSAIVMQNEKYETFDVVSLATGNRCITGDKISLHGKILNDSHAEVVARRSFMYFLYNQLNQHISRSKNSLELFDEIEKPNSISSPKYFKIKDHIKFHLYISTAPCGDGALFCSKENIEKNYETQVVLSTNHDPLYENKLQGLLRTKIEGGEGTIPAQMSDDCNRTQTIDGIIQGERLRTMSCSDKIARWNYLGIQGCLLSFMIKPVYLHSLILGNLFSAAHLSRAVCCRLEKFAISPLSGRCTVNHPDLVNVYIGEFSREIDKSTELSINWCHDEDVELVDGVTGQLNTKSSGNRDYSRISKASLFYEFQKLYNKLEQKIPIANMTYREVKSICREFEDRKKALYLKFHCAKYGSWICKPIELSEFRI